MVHLKSLDISKNNFEAVPSEIHYDGLETLILDKNPMSILKSHSFSGMSSLQKLSVCEMPNLESVHEVAFAGLRNLSILHMDYNPKLAFIDPDAFVDFQFPMVLRRFSICHNFLRYLPNSLLPELRSESSYNIQYLKFPQRKLIFFCS